MWIDSHAHLFDIPDGDLDVQLNEAAAAGVGCVLSTAVDCTSASTVIRQCDRWKMVWGAIGISPFDVASPPPAWDAKLRTMFAHPKVIAIGEIGIDTTNPRYPSMDLQRPMFEQQLDIARKSDLPAIIHSRGTEEDAVNICKNAGISKAVFHCFTGNNKALDAVVNAGYYVSFSGIITFRNTTIRDLVKHVPRERLLTETDTPYLAPVPHRGKINRPAWVALTGYEIARLRGEDADSLAGQIDSNFRRLFTKYTYSAVHK